MPKMTRNRSALHDVLAQGVSNYGRYLKSLQTSAFDMHAHYKIMSRKAMTKK